LVPVAGFALEQYNQNFDGFPLPSVGGLLGDSWMVYGNVWGPGWDYWYNYGPFDAPNGPVSEGAGIGFSQIVEGEGRGRQLNVFSDYNNANHADGAHIESLVFREQTIGPNDVTETWVFRFAAKRGNLEGATTALAFIKTLDPGAGYAQTNYITVDMTSIPTTWSPYSVSIVIDPSLDGQILQFGFQVMASNYEGSGIFYDNVGFYATGPIATEEKNWSEVKSLYR
jgi:hypothetical protein